tara:strand:- start:170 stop:331 length:162 start_codon:yes stop_codon:yes gene_type:complete
MELWLKFGGFMAIRQGLQVGVNSPIFSFRMICEFVFLRKKLWAGVRAAVALPR